MIIRAKTPADVDVVARLVLEAFNSKYSALCEGDQFAAKEIVREETSLRGRDGNTYVAERGGNVCGTIELITLETHAITDIDLIGIYMGHLGISRGLKALYMLSMMARATTPDECSVSYLAVARDARRSGVASCLLGHGLNFARAAKKKRLSLWVAENNVPARSLYESEGFEEAQRLKSKGTGKFFDIPEWIKLSRKI